MQPEVIARSEDRADPDDESALRMKSRRRKPQGEIRATYLYENDVSSSTVQDGESAIVGGDEAMTGPKAVAAGYSGTEAGVVAAATRYNGTFVSFEALDPDAHQQIAAELDLISFCRLRACSTSLRVLRRPPTVKDTLPPVVQPGVPVRLLSPNERVARLVYDALDDTYDDDTEDTRVDIKQSDLRQLIELGADLDARLATGRTLVLDLLCQETETLMEAVGNDIIYGTHGDAIDAAISLMAAGADPDLPIEEDPARGLGDKTYPHGMCAIHFVPMLCQQEWPGPSSTEAVAIYPTGGNTAVQMARKLAEALHAAGADFAAPDEPLFSFTACHAARMLCAGAGEAEETDSREELNAAWYRAAGTQALAILSQFCSHSHCRDSLCDMELEELLDPLSVSEDEDEDDDDDDDDEEVYDSEEDEEEYDSSDHEEEVPCAKCLCLFPAAEVEYGSDGFDKKIRGWCVECSYSNFTSQDEE